MLALHCTLFQWTPGPNLVDKFHYAYYVVTWGTNQLIDFLSVSFCNQSKGMMYWGTALHPPQNKYGNQLWRLITFYRYNESIMWKHCCCLLVSPFGKTTPVKYTCLWELKHCLQSRRFLLPYPGYEQYELLQSDVFLL